MDQQHAEADSSRTEGIFKDLARRIFRINRSIVPPSPRAVWFQLRDSAGKLYKANGVAKIRCLPDSNIANFITAVKLIYNLPGYLLNVPASSLIVYESLTAFELLEKRLSPGVKIKDSLGMDWKNPLIVIVPPSESDDIIQGSFRFNSESIAAREAFAQYRKTATHLINEPSMLQLKDLIEKLRTGEARPGMPFIFLQGSSGIGKSQTAMTLLSTFDPREIFYMVAASKFVHMQDIYCYYQSVSNLFTDCARKDYSVLRLQDDLNLFLCKRLASQKLYLFGFACALIEGKYGQNQRAEISPTSADDVFEAMEKAGMKEKRPIVLLDECNYYTQGIKGDISGQKATNNAAWLRLCRNVFRSIGFVVVAAGTEARAVNISILGEISKDEEERDWCYIYSAYPSVKESCLDQETLLSLDQSCRTIILNSRPWFAILALKAEATKKVHDIDLILTEVFDDVVRLKQFKLNEYSLLGQLILPLNTAFNMHNSSDINSETLLIHRHFARLYTAGEHCMTLTNKGNLRGDDDKWIPQTVFPQPSEDALLHLAFMGTKDRNPIFSLHHSSSPYRAQMDLFSLHNRDKYNLEWMKGAFQKSKDISYIEGILASVLCIASHSNGIHGAKFINVLHHIAYHLSTKVDRNNFGKLRHESEIKAPSSNTSEKISRKSIDCLSKFSDQVFPFLSAPNTKWPESVKAHFPSLANSVRAINGTRIHLKIEASCLFDGLFKAVSCAFEFRGRKVDVGVMEEILERVPKNSYIHVVLTTRLQNSYFTKTLGNSILEKNNLKDCLFVKMAVDDYGNGVLSNLEKCLNIHPRIGSSSRPRDYNRLVIFIEIPGFEKYLQFEDTLLMRVRQIFNDSPFSFSLI